VAILLTKLRGRVRSKIRDIDGKMASPNQVEIDQAICDAYIALQADLPQPTIYVASGITIAGGGAVFSLPVTVASSGFGTGTEEYAGQVDLQLVSNGRWLRRKTIDELRQFFDGQQATVQGVPEWFALYEDNATVVRGVCYPAAKASEVCNMYASLSANDLRDYVGTGGTEGLDTATAKLSDIGAAALVNRAAADMIDRMDDAALKLRGINQKYAAVLRSESESLIYQEAGRRSALESNGRSQLRVP
jgi:hypothetical protein